MNCTNFNFKEIKMEKIGDNRRNIIVLPHNNEPLEWLLKQMLKEAYKAGYMKGKMEREPGGKLVDLEQRNFANFYINFVDCDAASTVSNSNRELLPGKDDVYNTLLDLIHRREQFRWNSGFHEGCNCVFHKEQSCIGI